MKLRLLASAVLVAAASASTTGIAHAAVAPPTVTITAAYDSSADGIDLTLTRPANWRWGNCSLTGSYSDANETTYTINVPPFDAGSSYNSPATYAGTIAANFNAVGPLTNIQITATCHLSGRQAYKASVKVAHLKTQIAAAPAAHTGCTQGRVKDSWIVSCGGSAATVTWTHTFPPNAVVGTRGMRAYWATDVGATKYGRTWFVGRTVHQTVHVRRFVTVRFAQIEWAWKTSHTVTRYKTVTDTAVASTPA